MKGRKLLSALALFVAISSGMGQCPDNLNIYLTSQEEVEEFATNYPECTDIYGLAIEGNDITSLENLHFLNSINWLYIANNDALISLSGLENINTENCNIIQLIDNPVLADISQLLGISGFVERFEIVNNDALTNLAGLQNLEGLISGFTIPLTIMDNDNLINLHGLEGFSHVEALLEEPGNPGNIFFDVVIEDNDALQSLEGLGQISNPFKIKVSNNNTLPNLNGLQHQDSIDWLFILENDDLVNLEGLKQGSQIGWLHIENNNGLVTLNGLDSVANIENLSIISNNNLQDITSLPLYTSSLSIYDNDSLIGLSAFEGITSENIRSINFYKNDILTSLASLQSIEILRSLYIYDNPSLETLSGLQNLKQVESLLYLRENQSLSDITSLSQIESIERLEIIGNPSLISLWNFAIDTANFASITIKDNPNLPACEAASICNFLQNFSEEENEVEIVNNAQGCNSRVEVEAACGIIGIEEVVFDSPLLKLSPNPAKTFFEVSFVGQENKSPIIDIRIFDGLGRLVYQNEPKADTHKIEVDHLCEGIYVVLVNGRYSKKVLIQK